MTFDEFISIGRVRSKMPAYKLKKQKAIELSRELLEQCEAPYLALSGGKDSVAMAFIVDEAARQCGKQFRLWAHVSDASFPGTVETCQAVADRLSRPLDIYESTDALAHMSAPKKQAFGKQGIFFDSIRSYAADKDLSFVGVRASESKRRMRAAKVHGQTFYSKSMGDVTVCHPILWFRLEDVAAALWEYDAPIHPIYRKMQLNNFVNGFHEDSFIRLGYITSKDLLNKGTAVFLKVNYPDKFNELAQVWPEIQAWT